MEKVVIKATKRDVIGKKVGALRREGSIPGVIYGHHIKPISILMNTREVTRSIAGLTSSSIVTVDIDGEEHAALIREKQRDYLRNRWTHIDFQAVSLKEKIRASVQVVLVGVAPAVKNFNGIVLHEKETVEVEALPTNLPERIEVDLSVLANIGDVIRVSDLKVAEDVTIFDGLDEAVVIMSSQSKEETEDTAESADANEPEVVEKGKKEVAED